MHGYNDLPLEILQIDGISHHIWIYMYVDLDL
jgi:hypothetical protein